MPIVFQKWNNEIAKRLQDGQIMLYPSDTIWAIGCDATNQEACQRIFTLKQRSIHKSFIILMKNIEMLKKHVSFFHPICYDLIEETKEALTIVYPQSIGLAQSVIATDGSVGIRLTNDSLCLQIIQSINKPIVSTSANLSLDNYPKSFEEINLRIKNGVDFIIEENTEREMNKSSKIIKVDIHGHQTIIR